MIDPLSDVTRHSYKYGDQSIYFNVRRQAARKVSRISIHVEPSGCVLVDAPKDASVRDIVSAVKKRARWINGHLNAFDRRRSQVLPREYVSGESFLYLGRRFRLKVIAGADGEGQVIVRGGHIEVHSRTRNALSISTALDTWVRSRARIVIANRLEEIVASLRWVDTLPPLRFQMMKVQWGSCSPSGRLTINPYLVKAHRECIDYVLVHELCHLREHNHSSRFYKLLDRHDPGWRQRKRRLDNLADVILNR